MHENQQATKHRNWWEVVSEIVDQAGIPAAETPRLLGSGIKNKSGSSRYIRCKTSAGLELISVADVSW